MGKTQTVVGASLAFWPPLPALPGDRRHLYLAVFKRAVKVLLKHNRGKGYFMTCDAYT